MLYMEMEELTKIKPTKILLVALWMVSMAWILSPPLSPAIFLLVYIFLMEGNESMLMLIVTKTSPATPVSFRSLSI